MTTPVPIVISLILLLPSCGEKDLPTAQTPAKLAEEKPPPAEVTASLTWVPQKGKSYSFPNGAQLITHWDEIQRRILALPPSENRDYQLGGAIKTLAAADPALAAAALAEWKHAIPSQWADAAKTVVLELWKKDPAAALDFLLKTLPENTRAYLWPKILAEIPSKEAADILEKFPATSSSLQAAANVLSRWVYRDPEAAARWLDRFASGLTPAQTAIIGNSNYTYFTLDMADLLSPTNGRSPDASRKAFEAATLPAAKRLFAAQYLRETAQKNPDQLSEITAEVEKVLTSADAAELRLETAQAQMRQDPFRYFAELTPEEIQALPDRFLTEMFQSMAGKDSAAAARQAVALDRPDDAASCVFQWFELSPAAATDFVLSLDPGPARQSCLARMFEQFIWKKDFVSAEKYRLEITDPQRAQQADFSLKSARERHAKNANGQ